jgi:septum formation protein
MELILASNSPRRKEILTEYGFNFKINVSEFCETMGGESPESIAEDNAVGKAKEVFYRLEKEGKTDFCVLSADTIVCFNGRILGKPKSTEQAVEMLTCLSSNTHKVITGYAIISKNNFISGAEKTEVVFNSLTEKEILSYVSTGKPMDKAGAYGVQDGFNLVKSINGSYFNVVGLPIETLAPILTEKFNVNRKNG